MFTSKSPPVRAPVGHRRRRFHFRISALEVDAEIPQGAPGDAALNPLFERCRARRVIAAQAIAGKADAVGVDIVAGLDIIDQRFDAMLGLVSGR